MKKLLLLSAVLFSFIVNAQNTGTIKLVKANEYNEIAQMNFDGYLDRMDKPKRFYPIEVITSTTFAGKSSPYFVRSQNSGIGYILPTNHGYDLSLGLTFGNGYPTEKYRGYTTGAYARFFYNLLVGPTQIQPMAEVSYKRLFNKMDAENLDQFSIGAGVGIPVFRKCIPGFNIGIMGNYKIDYNAQEKFSGFYPSLVMGYNF